MSEFVELRRGMRLSIPDPGDALHSYYTSTVRRVDRRGVLIDVPRVDGDELSLTVGEDVLLFTQYHGRTYQFTTKVLESGLQLLVDHPGEANRMERRSFYRLLITIPVVSAEVIHETGSPEEVEAMIVDISGGGVRLRIDHDLPEGTVLGLVIVLGDQRLRLDARIVHRSTVGGRGRSVRHESQCEFVDISRADQDRIVRFIFEKQREYSQKGVA